MLAQRFRAIVDPKRLPIVKLWSLETCAHPLFLQIPKGLIPGADVVVNARAGQRRDSRQRPGGGEAAGRDESRKTRTAHSPVGSIPCRSSASPVWGRPG